MFYQTWPVRFVRSHPMNGKRSRYGVQRKPAMIDGNVVIRITQITKFILCISWPWLDQRVLIDRNVKVCIRRITVFENGERIDRRLGLIYPKRALIQVMHSNGKGSDEYERDQRDFDKLVSPSRRNFHHRSAV